HVALSRETQHALPFLPVGNIKAPKVDFRVVETLRRLGDPRAKGHREIGAGHDRLAPEDVRRAGEQHAHSVDLKPMQALDGVVDGPLITPAHQPEGGGAVEKIVLACPLPNEVPGVLGINPDRASPVAVRGPEGASVRLLDSTTLLVS